MVMNIPLSAGKRRVCAPIMVTKAAMDTWDEMPKVTKRSDHS